MNVIIVSNEDLVAKILRSGIFSPGDLEEMIFHPVWHGKTILSIAVGHGDEDDKHKIIKLLLDYGVDPNIVDENGDTALMEAASGGEKECVEVLLDDPRTNSTLENRDKRTALDVAKIYSSKYRGDPEKSARGAMIETLLLNHRNKNSHN